MIILLFKTPHTCLILKKPTVCAQTHGVLMVFIFAHFNLNEM